MRGMAVGGMMINRIEFFICFFIAYTISIYIYRFLKQNWSVYQYLWARLVIGAVICIILLFAIEYIYLKIKKLIKK